MDNPYAGPAGPVAAATYKPRFLQLSGRIGRMRYLQYSGAVVGLTILLANCAELLALASAPAGRAVALAAVAVLILGHFIYARRRLQDLGETAWTLAVAIIPGALVLLFMWLALKPGSPQPNRFGPPPAPPTNNLRPARLAVAMLLLVVIVGAFLVYTPEAEGTAEVADVAATA